MKEILDVIHNTIYQFFDVCGDDEEAPMSDKDKLLLEVNKAICDNLKALEQEKADETTDHPEWIDYEDGQWIYAKCPVCGSVRNTKTPFCPICGTKMKGVIGK